jgi:hypothetical protein
LRLAAKKVSAIIEFAFAFLEDNVISNTVFDQRRRQQRQWSQMNGITYCTTEASPMPVSSKGLDHHILNDRLPATLAFTAETVRVTSDAPRITFLFDKRHGLIERIATLGAEEVTWVPIRATCDNAFALDGRLA